MLTNINPSSEADCLSEGVSFNSAFEWESLGLRYYLGTNGKQQNFTSARLCFEKALLLNPRSSEALFRLGCMCETIKQTLIKDNPTFSTAAQWYVLGDYYYSQQDFLKARVCFEIGIKDPCSLYKLGFMHEYLHSSSAILVDKLKAKEYYREGAKLGDLLSIKRLLILEHSSFTHASKWHVLGDNFCKRQNGKPVDFIRARICFEQAIALNPQYGPSLYKLGWIHEHAGQRDTHYNLSEAKKFYTRGEKAGDKSSIERLAFFNGLDVLAPQHFRQCCSLMNRIASYLDEEDSVNFARSSRWFFDLHEISIHKTYEIADLFSASIDKKGPPRFNALFRTSIPFFRLKHVDLDFNILPVSENSKPFWNLCNPKTQDKWLAVPQKYFADEIHLIPRDMKKEKDSLIRNIVGVGCSMFLVLWTVVLQATLYELPEYPNAKKNLILIMSIADGLLVSFVLIEMFNRWQRENNLTFSFSKVVPSSDTFFKIPPSLKEDSRDNDVDNDPYCYKLKID